MFYFLSKLFWLIVEPANLFVLLLTLGVLLLHTRWHRLGRRLLVGLSLAGLMIAIVPVGLWLIVPLENRFQTPDPAVLSQKINGIVVLGGGISVNLSEQRSETVLNDHADRLAATLILARRYPDAKILYASGSPAADDPGYTEADAARDLLIRWGVASERIFLDRQSRNTYQNAVEAKKIARPGPGENWLLVTSAFHMPRAIGVFRQVEWDVIPYPVDFQTDGQWHVLKNWDVLSGFGQFSLGLKEWIGLTVYYMNGYSAEWLPKQREQIDD